MKSLITALILLIITAPAIAQEFKFVRAEAYYGYGYTAFDIEEWVGSSIWNWEQANHGPQVQVFFFQFNSIIAGVQLGYQTLFWYETRRDAGFGTPIYRQYRPGSTQIMLIGQAGGDTGLFGEFGIGGFSGEAISGFALGLGAGYRIGLKGGWAIPFKVRIDPLFSDQTMLISSVNVGVSYRVP